MEERQQPEFDFEKAIEDRDAGMEKAAANQREMLELAREIAGELGRIRATVTSDDVRKVFKDRELPWIGNAAGMIFRSGDWEFAGFAISDVKTGHGNRICQWRLKRGR